MKPGPFEIKLEAESSEVQQVIAVANGPFSFISYELESAASSRYRVTASREYVERRFECDKYETCLGLAAALNWNSFTCYQCSGELNQQLLWRAHHSTKKDSDLADLCQLPCLHPKIS